MWLIEAEADYRELMSFTTFLDWAIAKVETLGSAGPPSVTYLVHLVVPGGNPNLHQLSAVPRKLNAKSAVEILKPSSLA